MPNSSSKLSSTHRALITRYLIWAYKSTKESFDRLERKTTQLMADEFIWKILSQKAPKDSRNPDYAALMGQYRNYIDKKKEQPIDGTKHQYLCHHLEAVEAVIKHFLGTKALNEIRQ